MKITSLVSVFYPFGPLLPFSMIVSGPTSFTTIIVSAATDVDPFEAKIKES